MSAYILTGECVECCSPCDAPLPARHHRFQQVAASVVMLGFQGLRESGTYYGQADVSVAVSRYGALSGASPLSFTMTQPTPTTRTMLFALGTTYWNDYDVGDDIWTVNEGNGWTAHNPSSQHLFPSNRSNQLSAEYSNGLANSLPTVSADPTWLDGFYWVDDITAPGSDTDWTWPAWSSLDSDGFGRLDTPVAVASGTHVVLSVPIRPADWIAELDNRLAAFNFPIGEGEGHNKWVERDDAGNIITQRSNGSDYDVLHTCEVCVAENTDPTTGPHYLGQLGTILCPEWNEWEAGSYYACRKAPPGRWAVTTCDDIVRYFAFYYEWLVQIDGADLETGTVGGPATQPAARRAVSAKYRPARAKGKIRVTGMDPGEPYIERFVPQGGEGYTDTLKYCPGTGVVDVDPPSEPGYIAIYPYVVP